MGQQPMKPGDNTTRGTIPLNGQDARKRGLTGDGMPASPDKPSKGAASGTGRAPSGSSKLGDIIERMSEAGLADQHDLNAFCEDGRKLAHYLAVLTALAAGELECGARDMAKQHGGGWGAAWRIKRVTKRLHNTADHFGSAGAGFVGAWTEFERVFAEMLDQAESKTKSHKRFTIR
jgi:hypothetical protein